VAARLEPLRSKMAPKDGVEALAETTRSQLEAVSTVRPRPGRRWARGARAHGGGGARRRQRLAGSDVCVRKPVTGAGGAGGAGGGERGGGALRAEEIERLDSLLERRREAREHRARLLSGLESVTLQDRLRPPRPPAPARARR
jgi:hypothetical protein